MRIAFILFLNFVFGQWAFANMASPLTQGSMGSSPFISKYVDILDESILIILNKEFNGAKFIVEYHIRSEKEGIQIPLLFYAVNYNTNFKVWMDGKEIVLKALPQEFQNKDGILYTDFNYFFQDTINNRVDVYSPEILGDEFYVSQNELKYFETDISSGEHVIRVEYTAEAWIDARDWINEYSLRYALSPAKFWKSFGTLKVTLDATKCNHKLSTNLGDPESGSIDSIATWSFNKLPVEIIYIDSKPEVGALAQILVNIGPASLGFIVFLLLVALHLFFLLSFRRKSLEKRFSWVMISGSFLVPAVGIIFYMLLFPIIDAVVGLHASGRHGYYFIIVLFYPFVMPIYLLIMWLTDKLYKKYLLSKNQIIT